MTRSGASNHRSGTGARFLTRTGRVSGSCRGSYQTNAADWFAVATHGTVAEVGDEATICSDQLVAPGGEGSTTEFVVSPAEAFTTDKSFDVVFISGLFVYMNDDQAERLTENLAGICGADTTVLLRDGTGLTRRHEIDNRFSQHLKADYSATYRTASEYEAMFSRHGFEFCRQENMFDESCALNKYPETRLRIYEIKRGCGEISSRA